MLWEVLQVANDMMFVLCALDGIFAKLAKPLMALANMMNLRLSSLDLRDLANAFFAIGLTISRLG
jgi:hypothetical protein